jgi:TonB family protein
MDFKLRLLLWVPALTYEGVLLSGGRDFASIGQITIFGFLGASLGLLTQLYQVRESDFDVPRGAKGPKGTLASADWRETSVGPAATGNQDAGIMPVQITFKPNPTYTEEARKLKVEGEVLLEVEFNADATLHVNRVVHGLGHGLDEAAIVAANKMQFRPAMRDGQPVDSKAVVHVVYQLN